MASAKTVLRSPRGSDVPLFLSEQERAQLAYLESIAATEDAELFRTIAAGVRQPTRTADSSKRHGNPGAPPRA